MAELSQIEIEKKWQQRWHDARAFVQDPSDVDHTKPKFFATVAFPYANSALHIGHGRMNTAADIIVRYQRLLGKAVLFPMGFHISGTPVLAVADGLRRGDAKQEQTTRAAISEYVPDEAEQDQLLKDFSDPYKIADFFSGKIEQTFDTVGLSIDWSKKFSTGDAAYQRFVQWQFCALERCGILEKGRYPILYSTADQSAVGEDDIKDGDVDKVAISKMSYILFEMPHFSLAESNLPTYFAVATLRPDALFGTTNLWVDPRAVYARVRLRPVEAEPDLVQVWVVGEAAVCKLESQFDDVQVVSWHEGKEFVGESARTPLTEHQVPIAEACFLDSRHGTGLVYSSPGGSPHDYMGFKDAQREGRLPQELTVINTVAFKDKKGKEVQINGECPAADKIAKYEIETSTDPRLEECKQELYKEEHYGGELVNVGKYSNIPIKHAKDKVHAALVSCNLGGTLYEPSRRAETRAGQPVIVARLDGQWFLNYSGVESKAKACKLLDKMEYLPPQLKDSQNFFLEWVQRRPCARRRGIGTNLPQDPEWVVEPLSDSTMYQIFYPLSQFLNDGLIAVDDVSPNFLDWVYLAPEAAPPPTPAAGSPAADSHPATFEEVRRICRYWGGVDLRYTAATHMSNHLAFLIYHYSLLFTQPEQAVFHPRCIAIGGLLKRDGEKISKTKGNGMPLIQVRERFGADLYRLYIAVGPTFDKEFDFRDNDIAVLHAKYEAWKKMMFAAKRATPRAEAEMTDIDRWLLSKFYSRTEEYFPAMEAIRFGEAYVSIFMGFMKDASYHTRRTSPTVTASVIKLCFIDYLLMMAPAVPHICEELYQGEGPEGTFASLLTFDRSRPFQQYIDKHNETIQAIPLELVGKVGIEITKQKQEKQKATAAKNEGYKCETQEQGTIHQKKEGAPLNIQIVQACDQMFSFFDILRATLQTASTSKVMEVMQKEFPDKDWAKFIRQFVPRTFGANGLQAHLAKNEEYTFLVEVAIPFLRVEFPNAEVFVTDADAIACKNRVALPGIPAIVLL